MAVAEVWEVLCKGAMRQERDLDESCEGTPDERDWRDKMPADIAEEPGTGDYETGQAILIGIS